MPDDPDFPSSEEMLSEARKELSEPLDEKALLEPVEFEESERLENREESLLFEPGSEVRRVPERVPQDLGSAARAEVVRAVKARLIVGLAVGILVIMGVVVAALMASGR